MTASSYACERMFNMFMFYVCGCCVNMTVSCAGTKVLKPTFLLYTKKIGGGRGG